MANADALTRILQQVEAAKPELDAYAPAGFGWYNRAVAAVTILSVVFHGTSLPDAGALVRTIS